MRSQEHLTRMGKPQSGGYVPTVPILTTGPATATLAAAGAVARVLFTAVATGGTSPFVWSITGAGGISAAVAPATGVVTTTVNPCGTVGAHTMAMLCTDARGQTKTLSCVVTLT